MCLLVGGAEYTIDVAGASYAFEMNGYCGPIPSVELGPKHEFWRAVSLWVAQGRQVEDGIAIWEEPRERPMYAVREVKQHDCGEQMYRESRGEPWTCWPCELRKRATR